MWSDILSTWSLPFSCPTQNRNSASRSDGESQNQSTGGPSSHATPPPFTSMPFHTSALPTDFASMFMNMAANAANPYQGQNSQDRHGEEGDADEPEIRIGRNINLNFGEQMPEELSGALRSVMEMFTGSGGPSHHNSQDSTNERPAPN
jgi:small glutamine-rich tetratricopeptide repeat-containing protein alpha